MDSDGNTAINLAQIKRNTQTLALLGASPVSDPEVESLRTTYERRCTEREEAWERQQKEEKIQKRRTYLAHLAAEYNPQHPRLYSLADHLDFFEPSFIHAIQSGTRDAFESIRDFQELSPGLYQYRIFREDVCQQLMEEVDSFNAFAAESGAKVTRPNSMNRYGLILNDIGFLRTMDLLMRRFVQPLAAAFFTERFGDG